MSIVKVQIQWRAKHGWTYRVYSFNDIPNEQTTIAPLEVGDVSDLVTSIDARTINLSAAERQQIETALSQRFPGSVTGWGKVPVNRK